MPSKLGEFIRLHREAIKPQDVGLPAHGRRRTPGLRREELAQLCAVSPTWLTWLEQGRPITASVKVLVKMVDVLSLTPSERAYLFRLADKLDPTLNHEMEQGVACQAFDLHAIVQAIKTPAYILDQHWDALAWNRPAQELFMGWLDQPEAQKYLKNRKNHTTSTPPNLLHFMFLQTQARRLITDWPERADRLVAEFRADCGKYATQEPLSSMIDKLMRDSRDFERLWHAHHVAGRAGGTRQFAHPIKGALTFEQVTLSLSIRRGFKLVMLLPKAHLVQ